MSLKSGLLYHYCGGVRKRWKRRYCVLYEDGYLVIHKDSEDSNVVKKLLLKLCCKKISTGIECHTWNSMVLPKGVEGLDGLFSLKMKYLTFSKTYVFLTDRNKDCEEWVKMVEKVLFTSSMLGDCIGVFSEAMNVPVSGKNS